MSGFTILTIRTDYGIRMNNFDKVTTSLPETGTQIKTIALENGQTLILSDRSRKISADAYIVVMQATMEIKITPDLFASETLSGVTVDQIRDTLGETVIYEYRLERNFILNHEKDAVLASLVDTFMTNMEQYISHPRFAPKLVLKQYNDRK
ncbi:MAG: hypothetical protein K9K63_18795 [Desulfotignum sp.]|nr:hypothetical protein [Desulfotignum sp.]MCF8089620.1 hypothetical protein [Desulfotignum sp.]MCF8139350.1 hypothetical protein [Desulfotignum sp.]